MKDTTRPPDNPQSLEDWLWYVRRYEDGIFVREQIDGTWQSVALSALPPERWAYHVARWMDRCMVPCRVRDTEEIAEDEA